MSTGQSLVSRIPIDISEPNCRDVEKLIKAKEATYQAFMLARQLAQWGIKCLNQKMKNSEDDEFPKDQEEILLRNIKNRIEDLKPGLIRYDNKALKRLGLILQEYIPGGDAAFNRILMTGLQSTYSLIYEKMKDKLKNIGKNSQKKDELRKDWEGQVAQAIGDPTVELYEPNPGRPEEEYLNLQMDVNSLFKIKSKIGQFLQESKEGKFILFPNDNDEYDLALQRLFHITGEYLKQTEISPNLSVNTRESLMKKGIPVDALSEYRDMLAHYQLFPMIKSTTENRDGLEKALQGVEKILEIEISEMENNFLNKIIKEKTEDANMRELEGILEECKMKGVTCLLEKMKLEMKEDTSKNLWRPETVEEFSEYAARMKSTKFPQRTTAEDGNVQFEIVPDTKKAIVDFIIASKKKLYDDIHRELEGKIDEGKYSLPESVIDRLQALLKNHEYDMEIMKVRSILSHGGTADKESLDVFFRQLPAGILEMNEANNLIIVKDELKKYFNSEEISDGVVWDPPNEAKLIEARSLLQKDGEQGKKVIEFLTKLHERKEGEVIDLSVNLSPTDYTKAIGRLEHVDGKFREKLYSVSIEWKKNECVKLLNYCFTDLMPLYDEILGKRDIRSKKNKESERRVKELSKNILPITDELYEIRVKEGINEMIPLENPSAVESQVINVVELLKRSKDISDQLEGKSTKRKNTSKEASGEVLGDLETSTEKDILKFRNYLAHGDAMATLDKEVQMAEEVVKLKDNIKGGLAKAASENKKVEFNKIGDMINEMYPAGALAIKEILCPNSGKPSKRPRKAREVQSCLTWEDIEEVVEGSADSIDPDNIKIDSEKMLNVLYREVGLNEGKFDNYVVLTTVGEMRGMYQNELVSIVHHEETYSKHMEKVEEFSGAAMHGMMAKNILGEILRGDYKDVEVDLGFLGGSFLLGQVSKIAARNGAIFAKEGSVMLGESLKMASPLLARGVSVFIAYDLWNQVQAMNSGDKDAIVNVVGDSLQLAVDTTEVGIEIAEGLSLIEGVSAVTGPIGMAIGAIVFVGTEIYKAVKVVEQIDKNIHLNGLERFNEGLRAFIGVGPSLYIDDIIEDKQGNNVAVQNAMRILKNNPHIQRYVFPSYVQVGCYEPMSATHSVVRLTRKVNNIEWSRARPDDVPGVNIFCKPKGVGEPVSNSGTYYCENAIGVEYNKDRTDNYTLINLGIGNDRVVGFQDSGNIFIVDRHNKTLVGGSKDDSFIFHRDPATIKVKKKKSCKDPLVEVVKVLGPMEWIEGKIGEKVSESLSPTTDVGETTIEAISSYVIGYIDGAGGLNTIDVEGLRTESESKETESHVDELIANFPEKSLTYADQVAFTIKNINRFLGMTERRDHVVAACNTTFIDGRGGYNEYNRDVIRIPDAKCSYNTTLIIHPFTNVTNDAPTGNFQYFVQGDIGKNAQINLNRNSTTKNTFKLEYALDDLASIIKSKDTIKFSFVKDFYDTFDTVKLQNSFNLTVREHMENSTYLLMDNTRIVVGQYNLYGLQNTDTVINHSIQEYIDISTNLNMYLVVHSNNEVLTIAGPQNDVLTNDPISKTSHFVSGAGQNIFSFVSGHEKLTKEKLPINDIVIHYFNNITIDRIDLRKILAQVRKDLGKEISVAIMRAKNDLILNLFIHDRREDILTIRLKHVVEYLWYSKIQIVLDTVYSIEESNGNFKFVPLPLIFDDPNLNLIVIHPRDVVEGMKIKISKKLKNFTFARNKDALIITNSLNSDLHKYPLATVVLNGFYSNHTAPQLKGHTTSRPQSTQTKEFCSKMASLSVEFEDKTILLSQDKELLMNLDQGSFLREKKRVKLESFRNLMHATQTNGQLLSEINSSNDKEAEEIVRKNEKFISAVDGWVNPLAHAVIQGNTTVVSLLTRFGHANVTAKDIYGYSPLFYAVKYQGQEIIDYFMHTLFDGYGRHAIMTAITSELPIVRYVTQKLKHRNEWDWHNFVKTKEATGATLLHYAVINGNLDVVKYLIKKGGKDGDPNVRDRYDRIPLYYAVQYHHSSVVGYLIQAIRTSGHVPLSLGVRMGSLETVHYLVEMGEDIYETDKHHKTPLFYAIQGKSNGIKDYLIKTIKKEGEGQVLVYPIITGDKYVLASLMKMNISINKRNILGKTPLHYSAMYGNLEMVTMLVEKDADLEARDASGQTPLDYALKNQHTGVVEYLCKTLRLDPLVASAKAGKMRLVSQFIKNKTDLEKTDGSRNTLLHSAVLKQSIKLVKYLIEKGSNPNAANWDSQTPLHHAAINGNLHIAKILIGAKADIDAEDKDYQSPLDNALGKGRTQVIIYLCEVEGVDALFNASKGGCLRTVKYLVQNGANIHKRDETQQTLLHMAVISQQIDLVEYLVENGIDANVKNKHDQTPLHYVVMYGGLQIGKSLEIGKYLIRKGADINARDLMQKTPLVRIIMDLPYNYIPLVKLFVENGADIKEPLKRAERRDKHSTFSTYLRGKMKGNSQRKRRQIDDDEERRRSDRMNTRTNHVFLGVNTTHIDSSRGAHHDFLSGAKSSLNWLLNNKADDTSQTPLSQMSPRIDANGTIMLLDLLIRQATGQKYVGTPDRAESPLEIQVRALNVVQIFEETLNNTAAEFGIDDGNLNFDPVALQSIIIRQLRMGESSGILKTLYTFAKKACSESLQCAEFLQYLRIRLEQDLGAREK